MHHDDADMLSKLFLFLQDHSELKEHIGYINFIHAVESSHPKLTALLCNIKEMKGDAFNDAELYNHIIETSDFNLADYIIAKNIISYPRMWQLSSGYPMDEKLQALFDHLLDYKKYRYYISYYREYLLKHGKLNQATKLIIKDPLFAEEALTYIEKFYKRDDSNIHTLKQMENTIPLGILNANRDRVSTITSDQDTIERALMILERSAGRIFAIALEEDDDENLMTYIFNYHTPFTALFQTWRVIYNSVDKTLTAINGSVVQPSIYFISFVWEWMTRILSSLPETMNPMEIWDDVIHKKSHVEWTRNLNSLGMQSITYDNLKVLAGNVADIKYEIGEHFEALRKLLGYLYVEQQIHFDKKKKIIFDVINAITYYTKNNKISYELLEGHDVFKVGAGINQYISYEMESLNINHPFYRFLYANPLPLMLNAIPVIGKSIANLIADYVYPKNKLPVIIIPNEVKWYQNMAVQDINEDSVLKFYVEHAPMEVWFYLVKCVAGNGPILSQALDIFRIIRHGTDKTQEVLRDVAEMVLQSQKQLPTPKLNAAFIFHDIASEVDWACIQLLTLVGKQDTTTLFNTILFADRTNSVGSSDFFEATSALGISEFVASNINRVQYDTRQLVKLAYFMARCKMNEYIKEIVPKIIDILILNIGEFFSYTDIPTPDQFASKLLATYLAPMEYHVRPFYLSNLPKEFGMINVEQPKLDIVKNVIMHKNPIDSQVSCIAAAARELAPKEIIDWLVGGYAEKFYMVPLARMTEIERLRKTKVLESDMSKWIEGAIGLMEYMKKPEIQPTPIELMEEARFQWWQDLRMGIGDKIGTFFSCAASYFDVQQYNRAMVRALASKSEMLHKEVPVKALFTNHIRDEVMVALAAGIKGTEALLEYMV